jgi:hypothetical protein
MFVKEEDASNDICSTSVVTEVPVENVFEEVEDVSLTILSSLYILYHLHSFTVSEYDALWEQVFIGNCWKKCY